MLRRNLLLLSTLIAGLPALTAQTAPDVAPPMAKPGPGPEVDPQALQVKLAEGTGALLVDGVLMSRTGTDLGAVARLFAHGTAEPLFTSPLAVLDELHAVACEVLPPGKRPGHLALWFRVRCATAAVADDLLAALQREPAVQEAYREPICRGSALLLGGGDPPPTTPPFMQQQTYFGPGPIDHAIRAVHGILGSRGQGVRMMQVEGDWIIDHEDVSKLVLANFIGNPPAGGLINGTHGLAGTSIICADRNCFGITGVADSVDAKFVSESANNGIANSLVVASTAGQPGDVVVLIEQFLLGQLGADDWVPVEYFTANFDAVRTATANGRIVVCSGANGGRSLDDPRHLRRFDRGYRDSGAIMVEGCEAARLGRTYYANFGSRIDVNARGENVLSAGYGTLFWGGDPRQAYTAGYAGTSAATPLVAGAVISLQGMAKRQLDRALTSAEILQLLHTHGAQTPDMVGRRLDLAAMARTLGVVDGLEIPEPDTLIGGYVDIQLSGPTGGGALLFVSFGTGSTNLGFNRKIHLDLALMQTLGFLPLLNGTASFRINVPNNASLSGTSLYLQAGTFGATPAVHVTNSGQMTVL
jgi:hypothetical protein